MDTDDWRPIVTSIGITAAMVIVIALPIALLTDWPFWVHPVIAGTIGGIVGPTVSSRIWSQRERPRNRPPQDHADR